MGQSKKWRRVEESREPVQKVLAELKERNGQFSAPEMWQIVGRSGRRSREVFRFVAGESFRMAQLRARLTPIRPVVLRTRIPLRRVAEDCGYSKLEKFEKSYLRVFGITPKDDRNESG